MSTPTLNSMASEQLDTQLAQLEDRLAREHAELGPARVHDLVEHERARFAGARVHAFVPILVERAVRKVLPQHTAAA